MNKIIALSETPEHHLEAAEEFYTKQGAGSIKKNLRSASNVWQLFYAV